MIQDLPAARNHILNLDKIEGAFREALALVACDASPRMFKPEVIEQVARTMLKLTAIARESIVVHIAHRDGLRGDYMQEVHAALKHALEEAGLVLRTDQDLILEVIHGLEKGTASPHTEAKAAALRRLFESAYGAPIGER